MIASTTLMAVLMAHAGQTPAPATPMNTVVVIVGQGDADGVAAALETPVKAAIAQRPALRLVTREMLSGKPAAPPLDDQIARASLLLTEGREAFMMLEAERAIEALTQGTDMMLERIDELEDKSEAVRALALLGSSLNQAGELRKARRVFRTLLFIEPGFRPDESDDLTESDVKMVQDIEEKLAFDPTGSVTVSAEGPGASVYVDGRLVGVTPLQLPAVAPGRHVIAYRRDGHQRVARRFVVRSKKTTHLKVTLPPLPNQDVVTAAALAVDLDNATFTDAVAELSRATGNPDELVLVRVDEAPKGAVKVRMGRFVPALSANLGQRGELTRPEPEHIDPLATQMLDELFAIKRPTVADTIPEESDEGLPGWAWGAAGAGAATVAAVVVTGVVVGGTAAYLSTAENPTDTGGTSAPTSSTGRQRAVERFVVVGY
jgi:hypothetical protein